jgi:hypothetical protein
MQNAVQLARFLPRFRIGSMPARPIWTRCATSLGVHTVRLKLTALPEMHPCLLWNDVLAATAAVLEQDAASRSHPVFLQIQEIPGYGSGEVRIEIAVAGVPRGDVAKARRTYESHRRVELAAIAVAGLALFCAGGHQIRDVSLRGTSADYLIDDERYLLEVAGRSRKSDFSAAWHERWRRLAEGSTAGFYVSVTEFETPASRLGFGA